MDEIREFVRKTAEYFAAKTPKEVTFADADNYDYEIFEKNKEWNKLSPYKTLQEEFPYFDQLWDELAEWDCEDEWTRERAELIIAKAKKALEAFKDSNL